MRTNTMAWWYGSVLGAALCCAPVVRAADGTVGPGNCNEDGFRVVLASVDGSGGGTVRFNCGTATIAFTGFRTIAHAVTIDGGGTITFDGGNASAFLQIFSTANVTLKNLTLQRGVFASAHPLENFGSLRLDRVTMKNNVSSGAAVFNQNNLLVERSTFSGNANNGTGSQGQGGALLNDGGTATIRYSTFSHNSAATGGGAIYSNSRIDVSNATFTGNSTTGSGSGGAAIYQGGGAGTVTYATVAGNSGQTFGGGIYNDGAGTLVVSRSIIADNTNGNCDGELTSGGYNLWFGSTQCPFNGPGDGAGDPKLGALAGNGGPTQTMLPGSGSAAINRIPVAQCLLHVDQRGGGRPSGNGCDSGAVEVGAVLDVIFQDGFGY